jgi:hypothetical protein
LSIYKKCVPALLEQPGTWPETPGGSRHGRPYQRPRGTGQGAQGRQAVQGAARRRCDLADRPLLQLHRGYILAAAYVNGDGDHLWTIRFRPDQPFVTTAGLEKVVSRYVNRIADELVQDDDET